MRVVESFPYETRHVEHVEIPMPDGVRLAARMWIPKKAEHTPVPALFEYIPYRKRDMTRERDDIHAPYMAGHGYAYVRVDIRGCGDSEGVILDQYTEAELSDGVEVIRWIAEQPWCNGKVGMMGISWGGFNALQIAARRPPALGAIVTVCSTDDTYQDNMHYMGGCLLGDNLSESTTMFAYQSMPPDPVLVGERWRSMWIERLESCDQWLTTWLAHQYRDDYWKPTSVCEDYSAIQVPVMAVSGWADGFTNALFRLMQHLDVPRMGLVGPWSHMYPHMGVPGPAIGFLQEALRWFDQYMQGIETGIEREPRLRIWMQDSVPPSFLAHQERPGRWVAEPSWPSPHIELKRWPLDERHLCVDGTIDEHARTRWVRSPLTTGLHAGKWCAYGAAPDQPGDQRREDGGSLFFETPPLEEPVEILGSPEVELKIAADQPVAQVVARLCEVLPDGPVTRVTYGVLNLTHRESNDDPKPLTPEEPVLVRFPLNAVAQRFRKNHRIRLSLSTSYWPLVWPPPEPTRITVWPNRSALHLPIRKPRPEDEELRPFGPPEGAKASRSDYIVPPKVNWRVVRDLRAERSTLEVTRHDGHYYMPQVDLTIVKRTVELYSSTVNDFDSIRGETRTVRSFERRGWKTRVNTRSVLTATPKHFRLHANLDAYEGDERVFTRTWTELFERKLV
ncbi:MAG TPA: CocE/NonD family hydrolase [Sandaracinaceae bacterium LLY-WYZ-13_1]|nr:CocE/NonD family hydrolase [Sandaracinaceae bacterium LLY-WYZ-13_1]